MISKDLFFLGFLSFLIMCPPITAQVISKDSVTSDTTENKALEPFHRSIMKKIKEDLPFEINGFVESRAGLRTQDDDTISKSMSIGEARFQLDLGWDIEPIYLKFKSDFVYDWVEKDAKPDVREANALFSPFSFMDIKAGRQILTWGTGDMLFINDLFPKDWPSFFIGRDDEYLKAPSDAVKTSLFSDIGNLDVVYTPRFDPDRYIKGDKISYYNDFLGRQAGEDDYLRTEEPDRWFRDDEIALRIFKNISGYEPALYFYNGFWKSPGGMDLDGEALFPRLCVYGGSIRGNVLKGIGNLETGYYDSRDDDSGTNPFIRNEELRFLAGYEQEIGKNFTAGLQYYIELMMDYDEYRRALPPGMNAKDQDRHVLTLRLTKLLMNQNLKISLFGYFSPTDADSYLRPKIHYKFSDHLEGEVGGNVFMGKNDYTFFGQFEDNSNIYMALRWSF